MKEEILFYCFTFKDPRTKKTQNPVVMREESERVD